MPPLSLPASTRSPEAEEILASPSGMLFVERARASSPGFTLTRENAPSVAAICWRLAGLPLALELAAAKTRFLDPATLLIRLDQALSTAWARDLPERQRTMRTTLDWSHNLLSEPESMLFRRLSVFVGGFSLEAAEAVGGTEGGAGEALDRLGALVEQSLVTRYRMRTARLATGCSSRSGSTRSRNWSTAGRPRTFYARTRGSSLLSLREPPRS